MRSLATFRLTPACVLHLRVGDLTKFEGDAVVNAANERMLGGSGVDGAIHRAAGPGLLKACKQEPVHHGTRCPTGEARITEGFNLHAKHVIHTVGPVFVDDETSQPLLDSAYRSSLELANRPAHAIRTVAFPAISCGVYQYPVDRAAHIALRACQRDAGGLAAITFVLFSNATAQPFLAAARELLGEPLPEDLPEGPPEHEDAPDRT